jgi:hypothetical protein
MDAAREAELRAMTEEQLRLEPIIFADNDELDLYYRLLTAFDVARNRGFATAYEETLRRLTPRQRRDRVFLTIRCSEGCRLVEIFHEGPDRGRGSYFLTGYTRRGQRTFYANGGTADDGYDPDLFAPISCRHGAGRFALWEAVELVATSDLPRGASRRLKDEVILKDWTADGQVTMPYQIGDTPPYSAWSPK